MALLETMLPAASAAPAADGGQPFPHVPQAPQAESNDHFHTVMQRALNGGRQKSGAEESAPTSEAGRIQAECNQQDESDAAAKSGRIARFHRHCQPVASLEKAPMDGPESAAQSAETSDTPIEDASTDAPLGDDACQAAGMIVIQPFTPLVSPQLVLPTVVTVEASPGLDVGALRPKSTPENIVVVPAAVAAADEAAEAAADSAKTPQPPSTPRSLHEATIFGAPAISPPNANPITARPAAGENEAQLNGLLPAEDEAELDATGQGNLSRVEPQDPHGISAAKMDIAMKNADKMKETAGRTEQELPAPATFAARELLPRPPGSARAVSPRNESPVDATAIALHPDARPVEFVATNSTGAALVTPAVDLRVRSLERTHDLVTMHAMQLRDSGSDQLRVVIKPGAGAQLSLELRTHEGGIEVQAQLQRGDPEYFQQHWPELQQRLEARGVRLAPLNTGTHFSSGDHHSHQQHSQSAEAEAFAAGAFAEFALAGSMTESPNRSSARIRPHRGWQSWA